MLARAPHRMDLDEAKRIGAERGRAPRRYREHGLQDRVAVADRLLAELFCCGALELRIFARQSVERAALHLGFSLVQRGENLRDQRIGVQPRFPVPDQRFGATGHGWLRFFWIVKLYKKHARLIWLIGNSQNA